MSRIKSKAERRARRSRGWSCPKCHCTEHLTKDYPDAVIYVCARCEFPERVVKP